MSETVNQASIVEVTEAFKPPARQGEARLARRRRMAAYGMLTPGALYLAFSFIVPLFMIVYTSLKSGGLLSGGITFTWEFSNYTSALSEYGDIFLRSIMYAAISTSICLLVAYPMAYWIAFYAGKWKSTLFFLILVPFFVSFIIRTVMWKFILADNGVLFSTLNNLGIVGDDFQVLQKPVAVISGLAYNFIPFAALPLYVSLERIDRRFVEAAKDLYATRWQAFRRIVLPLSFPGVFAAVILTFVPMTGDYVNSEVLGSNETFMIGQVIQQKFLREFNYPVASALSVMLMLGMLVLALVYARLLGTEEAADAAMAGR